jgi:cellulose synthase/poly-beta-1,6-N-acetylglucosamine synthase-like glycosyltransferase
VSFALLAKPASAVRITKALLSQARVWMLLICIWTIATLFYPTAITLLLAINMAFIAVLGLAQLWAALLPRVHHQQGGAPQNSQQRTNAPMISIHVPICNEPPHLVLETLEHIRKLNYSNFEVIVLDNNTQDETLWRPVEARCHSLGAQFKFHHVAQLAGFKAGALNLCLAKTDPRAAFVLVLDADYCVDPNLLEVAVAHFTSADIALVQFPQAYSNTISANAGLSGEYRHFFDVYMNMANHLNCVLATGTVSMIRRTALDEVGGWTGRSITEDVELGLHLLAKGYQGRYVNTSLGRGLMPTDARELRKQRRRWVFGNAQTLTAFVGLEQAQLAVKQRLGILIQLTAWFNLSYLPLLTFVVLCVGMVLAPHYVSYPLVRLSLVSLWLQWVSKLMVFVFTRRSAWFTSFLIHMSLAKQGAQSWLSCYLGCPLGFERTSKFASHLSQRSWWTAVIAVGVAASVSSLFVIHNHALLAALAFLTLCAPLSQLLLARQLAITQRVTTHTHNYLQDKWKGYLYE